MCALGYLLLHSPLTRRLRERNAIIREIVKTELHYNKNLEIIVQVCMLCRVRGEMQGKKEEGGGGTQGEKMADICALSCSCFLSVLQPCVDMLL